MDSGSLIWHLEQTWPCCLPEVSVTTWLSCVCAVFLCKGLTSENSALFMVLLGCGALLMATWRLQPGVLVGPNSNSWQGVKPIQKYPVLSWGALWCWVYPILIWDRKPTGHCCRSTVAAAVFSRLVVEGHRAFITDLIHMPIGRPPPNNTYTPL